ncbi:hypothetical protein D3P08_18555, partial [Paenibacillus nanensis]
MVTNAGDPVVSTDGDNWTKSEGQNFGCQARSMRFTGSIWVMGCTSGDIYTLAYGADPLIKGNWVNRGKAVNGSGMTGIAHDGNGTIVVTGEKPNTSLDGAIMTSKDGGNSFTDVSFSTKTAIYGVTYANGKFYAVGKTSSTSFYIYSSSDGLSWEVVTNPGKELRGIAYGNEKFVAVGYSGYIYVSDNGLSWSEVTYAPTASKIFTAVTFGVGKFYAVGTSETIISSADGVNWETENLTSSSTNFVNVVAANNRVFAFASGLFKAGTVVPPAPIPVADFVNTAKTGTTASFSWSAASGATGIVIEQSLKGANTWTTSTTGTIATNATSATVTGLTPGTEYDFRLVVTDGRNAGNSNVVGVKTDAVPINNFAGTGKTSTTASFSWSAAFGATGIIVQQSPKNANTWTLSSTSGPIAANATSATVTGLTPGTEYDFRLVVTGGSNAGNSNVVSVKTNAAPISDFATTGKTSTTANFSWSATLGATGIIVQQSPKGQNTWSASTTGTIATNATSATVTGLSPGTEYEFRLVVTGGSNEGNSNVVTVKTDAVPVSDFASTGKTSTTADFSWSAVTGATGIVVEQTLKGANAWAASTTSDLIATTATTATVTGLNPGTEYEFRLVVTGGSNEGNSNVVSVKTDVVPVSDFASTGKTSTTADFSWSAVNGATGIEVEQSLKGANAWAASTTSGPIATNATTATVTGLNPGTEYEFRLVVTGGSNEGNSNVVTVKTDAVPVSDFASTGKTSTTADFSWSAVTGATGIVVEQSLKGASTWEIATTSGPIATNSTTATVTGLNPGTEYEFRLVVTGGSNEGNSNVV